MNYDLGQKAESTTRTAYSYIRFSTLEQGKGTSYQRQFENSKEYANRKGLRLDTTLNLFDEGRSAFTGENREHGALSEFLAAVSTGKVKRGSVLIVENLDRLSRQAATQAITLFLEILRAGIEIVTLGDNEQVYTESGINSNFWQLIQSVMSFARGYEESAVKSQRLAATWKLKRADPTKKLTALAPAWVKLSHDRLHFEVIPDRAALINRVFELSASGVGHHRIAKTLNEESIPVWGRGKLWHSSYIMKLLSSRSVLGEFQPHQKPKGAKRVPVGECFENYFPKIVAPELFHRVHAGRKMRLHKGGRVGPHISNLFTHIAKCGYCGSSMQFVQKGGGCTYLVCGAAKAGAGCKYMSWPYEHFERLFLQFVEELDFSDLATSSSAEALKQKRVSLEAADSKITELALKQRRLMELVEGGTLNDTGEVGQRLRALQVEEEQALQERDALKAAYEVAYNHYMELNQNSQELVRLTKMSTNPDTRQKLMTEIRRKVKRIDVCPSGGLRKDIAIDLGIMTEPEFNTWLAGQKRDEDKWGVSILFVNGERRDVFPRNDGYTISGSIPPSLRDESGSLTPEEIEELFAAE